jgi:hypothetical protein
LNIREVSFLILPVKQKDHLSVANRTKYFIRLNDSHLGGVVVSVLATGPKGCGFEPSQGDEFLRVTKICSTPSSWMESKAGRFYGI